LFAIPENTAVQIVLIVIITFIATLSVVAGLDRGIKRLSEINRIAALVLLMFVLLAGPSIFILNGFVENLGQYLDDFFYLSFWNETYTGGSWQNGWTVFYWGWWIAWSPFVGMFIARISRGRTIREFIAGVLLVPTLLTFFWLSVFGDSALYMELFGAGNMAQAVNDNLARSLFFFFDQLQPGSSSAMPSVLITAVSLLATLVVVTFFVTSSDSGSLVIDMITAGGKTNPPVAQRIFWASTEGVVAAALLIGGGLTALQTAAIITGLPFAVILVFMTFSLYRALNSDHQ
jgi:choline/glycine/proline betaine transport protein